MNFIPPPDASSQTSRSMLVLASPQQKIWQLNHLDPSSIAEPKPSSADRDGSEDPQVSIDVTIKTSASLFGILQELKSSTESYIVFSMRPGLIWDAHLIDRVRREVADFETLGAPWFCLAADGLGTAGEHFTSAFFDFEPTLMPDRGRRTIVQTAGVLYVVNLRSLAQLELCQLPFNDLPDLINQLILLAYSKGFGSYFSGFLYPCLSEHRGVHYSSFEDQVARLPLAALIGRTRAAELIASDASRRSTIMGWIETLTARLRSKHTVSFVIRTLFRRQHLLRRCLISIDYLCSCLGFQVEIVLASDVDDALKRECLRDLRFQFPHLAFTLADPTGMSGFSRVKNLISGLKATSGSRVCIIDDDDFYTPQAVVAFTEACRFGQDALVVCDTQIVNEQWTLLGVKHHNEIKSFGQFFPAGEWKRTLRGSNSVPLCGVIHPGWFARQLAEEYRFDFDCSEDFILHLLCFHHARRPPVVLVTGICAYQSHRVGDDNVSTVADRTGWTVDTGNGLYQFLIDGQQSFELILRDGIVDGTPATGQLEQHRKELQAAVEAHQSATRALALALSQRDERA